MADDDIVVGSFPKNNREEVRVTLSKFKGYDLVGVRQWFKNDNDEARPSKSGVTIRVDLLPELLNLIQQAQDIAVEKGILKLDEDGDD
ncbi:MAG: transcriptional coactivator p15/PC4 family protein [Gemmatimonadales bacterium]